jgi:hypothetical protein
MAAGGMKIYYAITSYCKNFTKTQSPDCIATIRMYILSVELGRNSN